MFLARRIGRGMRQKPGKRMGSWGSAVRASPRGLLTSVDFRSPERGTTTRAGHVSG